MRRSSVSQTGAGWIASTAKVRIIVSSTAGFSGIHSKIPIIKIRQCPTMLRQLRNLMERRVSNPRVNPRVDI
jgi:hypothetical protein